MSHYKSNLRDIEFNLFEVLHADEDLGKGPFAAMDADTARMILKEVDRFATDSIWAESFVPADRTPLQLDKETGDITIPEELHQALEAYYDAGWHTLPLPTSLGGYGAPPTIRWATSELLLGGHATAMLWPIGALMSMIIDEVGTKGQIERFAKPMVNDRWGGTMVLTEPDAGSDVGAGTTSAVKVEENGPDDIGSVWHIEGVKRFITSADAQTHPNTIHMVLARPEGGEPGTKGLRLYIVPKFLVNEDGSLGERNGVKVTNIEKKMGIKGSATCELTMGAEADRPCIGYLVGEADQRGAGISQMFRVIEYARMTVGTKAMATLSTGYLNALDYAKIRQQGPDMTQMADPTAPKTEIINHPDVRRLLMEQKAHAEGMRALVMLAGWAQDQKAKAVAAEDQDLVAEWAKREDMLLPLVKGYCSEKAYELLGSASLQTFGGSGFTKDYPIEQYIRDAKIDSLYEGTTAIQSLDFLFRKIVRDNGQALGHVAGEIQAFLDAESGNGRLKEERALLATALSDVQGMVGALTGYLMASAEDPSSIYKVGQHSVRLLMAVGDLLIGWLLLRQADVALAALGGDVSAKDTSFYEGKVGVARFFAKTQLPLLTSQRVVLEQADNALMDLPESAF